jgi:hypothetical protein
MDVEVKIMKIVSAFIGLAALAGIAFSSSSATAMPVAAPAQASSVIPAAYVYNEWGHCWHRPFYGYGYRYYHPHHWNGWGWHRHYWHPHYWGGWGWHRHWGYDCGYGWHHWHHWHQW